MVFSLSIARKMTDRYIELLADDVEAWASYTSDRGLDTKSWISNAPAHAHDAWEDGLYEEVLSYRESNMINEFRMSRQHKVVVLDFTYQKFHNAVVTNIISHHIRRQSLSWNVRGSAYLEFYRDTSNTVYLRHIAEDLGKYTLHDLLMDKYDSPDSMTRRIDRLLAGRDPQWHVNYLSQRRIMDKVLISNVDRMKWIALTDSCLLQVVGTLFVLQSVFEQVIVHDVDPRKIHVIPLDVFPPHDPWGLRETADLDAFPYSTADGRTVFEVANLGLVVKMGHWGFTRLLVPRVTERHTTRILFMQNLAMTFKVLSRDVSREWSEQYDTYADLSTFFNHMSPMLQNEVYCHPLVAAFFDVEATYLHRAFSDSDYSQRTSAFRSMMVEIGMRMNCATDYLSLPAYKGIITPESFLHEIFKSSTFDASETRRLVRMYCEDRRGKRETIAIDFPIEEERIKSMKFLVLKGLIDVERFYTVLTPASPVLAVLKQLSRSHPAYIGGGKQGSVFLATYGEMYGAGQATAVKVGVTTLSDKTTCSLQRAQRLQCKEQTHEVVLAVVMSLLYDHVFSPHFLKYHGAYYHKRTYQVMERIDCDLASVEQAIGPLLTYMSTRTAARVPFLSEFMDNIILQIIGALHQFQTYFRGCHNDLHAANIFIKLCDDTMYGDRRLCDIENWTYQIGPDDRDVFTVPNIGVLVKIGDLGHGSVQIPLEQRDHQSYDTLLPAFLDHLQRAGREQYVGPTLTIDKDCTDWLTKAANMIRQRVSARFPFYDRALTFRTNVLGSMFERFVSAWAMMCLRSETRTYDLGMIMTGLLCTPATHRSPFLALYREMEKKRHLQKYGNTDFYDAFVAEWVCWITQVFPTLQRPTNERTLMVEPIHILQRLLSRV